MKNPSRQFLIATICNWEKRIDSKPDYQRPQVWTKKQKQLLIDSILREYDIPKMYWRKMKRDDGIEYEVIDGQQRLRAIWNFKSGEFELAKDADTVNGMEVAGKKYEDLHIDVSEIFDGYPMDVVMVENEDEDEIRDMFLRLQNGTNLKAQEKRNAMPGICVNL